jgi:predicted 2-oxoglutarate/Fe(II)-dependent dioxygenase YbiX
MRHLTEGEFLPGFKAKSSINPNFSFDTLGGHRPILAFIASSRSDLGRRVLDALAAEAERLSREAIPVYVVSADKRDLDEGRLSGLPRGITVFWDFDCAIHRLYGMQVISPEVEESARALRIGTFVIRENLRLHRYVAASPIDDFAARLNDAVAALPPREPARPVAGHAPVLLIPDVVDRQFCRQLIDFYEERGGDESGFMRDVGGQTRGLIDPKMKRRRDCYIDDPELLNPLRAALERRVLPEIAKAFGGIRPNRVERYVIGCYDESDRGFFRAHRDNTSKGTAHRQFAMSLNLNAEEYEGGTLRFPEYGQHLYKPPTGGAVIFSCTLLHEAMPVTRGRRYVVLPFLYDDRGAAIRDANQKYLSAEPVTPVKDLTAA